MPNGLTALSIPEGLAMLDQRDRDMALIAQIAGTGYFERLALIDKCRRESDADPLVQIHMSFAPSMWLDVREEVSGLIYLNYCYEPELTAFLLRTLKPGDTFVDVGAHFGYFSLVAAQAVGPGGRVLSFEPMAPNFEMLARNTDGLDMIEPINAAAWRETTRLKFHYYGPALSAYSSFGEARLDPTKPHKAVLMDVAAVTLDQALAERDLTPAVVKIDAENSEQVVLDGMKETIARRHPIITVEVGDFGDRTAAGQSSRDLLIQLLDLGYELFDPGLKHDTPHQIKDFGTYTYANVVAIHAEHQHPSRGA